MASGARPRVLVAEDDEIVREILVAALGRAYDVTAVADGDQALVWARAKPLPDLILLDVMMPGRGGFATCRELKGESETAEIPVIFVTSMDDQVNEEEGFAAGAADYITKPVSPPLLRARVNVHLRLKQQYQLLAHLVDQRTADLQDVQRQARAMLKEYTLELEAIRGGYK